MKYFVVGLVACALVAFSIGARAQDPGPSHPTVWIDDKTGCHYLVTSYGGIERRMVDNGVLYIHMGCDPKIYLKK